MKTKENIEGLKKIGFINLVKEAKEKGYRKGTAIRYVPHAIDYVEGNYFEEENGKLKAYAKPKHERKVFNDFRHDTLYDGFDWVEIVDLSKRTQEQKIVDDMHNIG